MKTAALVCALAALGLALGCGGESSGSSEPKTTAKPAAADKGARDEAMKPAAEPATGTADSAKPGAEDGTEDPAEPAAGAAAPAPDQPQEMAAAGAAAEPEENWQTIISADWELGPSEERYFCQRITLTEDVYFDAIKAINPLGTHHTALTATDSPMQPDGLSECRSSLLPQGIFGSGVGTAPVEYPAGVGLRLRAGQQLLLNLRIYNVTDQPLKGTSGTAVRVTSADKVEHMAESLLAGPARFQLPVGRSTVTGKCTMNHDVTLFAVQPHMHQTGVHMKGVAHSSIDGEVVLHDGDYDFENQLVYSIDEVAMKQGDVVDVECTFDNQTDAPISFGESSDQEMCFLVLHRYPAAETPAVSCFF